MKPKTALLSFIMSWKLGRLIRRHRLASQPKRVTGGGITGEALSFTAPDDSTAADVLLALSQAGVPTGVSYKIDWIERTPGR